MWNAEVDLDDDGLNAFYRDGVEECDGYQVCDPCPFDATNDDLDNRPPHPNPSQADSDGDLAGDACDVNGDNDGVPNDVDAGLGTAGGMVGLDGCSLDHACPCTGA